MVEAAKFIAEQNLNVLNDSAFEVSDQTLQNR